VKISEGNYVLKCIWCNFQFSPNFKRDNNDYVTLFFAKFKLSKISIKDLTTLRSKKRGNASFCGKLKGLLSLKKIIPDKKSTYYKREKNKLRSLVDLIWKEVNKRTSFSRFNEEKVFIWKNQHEFSCLLAYICISWMQVYITSSFPLNRLNPSSKGQNENDFNRRRHWL